MSHNKKYDVIVIGAGLGGLTTAALLSKYKYSVLLLDRHYVTGGYSTAFERKGFEFDASIHWINNIELIKQVLKRLDALDRIEFKPFNPLTRIISPSYEIMLTFDVKDFQNQMQKQFPHEKENIARFVDEAVRFADDINLLTKSTFKYMSYLDFTRFGLMYICNKFPLIKKYSGYTAEQVINSYFRDSKLRTLIHSLGTTPDSSIYPIFCRIGWASEGNYFYPSKGGGNALSQLLTDICNENGTEIKLSTEVEKIIIKDGAACGIMTSDGTVYNGRFIVSNADALLTYNKLIGHENLDIKFVEAINARKKYPSFCMISMGTDYDLKSKGYKGETITYNPCDDIDHLMGNDLSINRKFIHLRSMRDNSLAPEGFNTISVGVRLPYSYKNYWMTGPNRERGAEYYKLKEEVIEQVLDNISNVLPDLKNHVKVRDLATPITYERYTLNSEGSMMGWEESTGGIRRKEPIKNFQRTGHWTFPGGGTPRVLISGMIVSDLIRKYLYI